MFLVHYGFYHSKNIKEKAINTLIGILQGIACDQKLRSAEIDLITEWLEEHYDLTKTSPFSELSTMLEVINADGIIDENEQKDLLWFCNKFIDPSNDFFNYVTADIQTLTGIAEGILGDGKITDEEITFLHNWLDERTELIGIYPYDELSSLLNTILKDGFVSEDERLLLERFFFEFVDTKHIKAISSEDIQHLKEKIHIEGICSTCPEIIFEDTSFCFTGESTKTTRKGFQNMIEDLGCVFKKGVSQKLNYLVVGNDGSPYWAYSCYGRKIEEAIQLRKEGHPILIVNELDFWDALQDLV